MRQHTIATPYLVGDVHFYTTEIGGETVLFDTGPPTPEGLHYLRSEVNLKKLGYVLVTHCHADHYGLIDYLCHHTQATILLPRQDALKFRHQQRRLELMGEMIRAQGFDERHVTLFRQVIEDDKVTPALPSRFEIAEESELPQRLGIEILPCPGHSQSDLVYLCGDEAVTGDVLLRGIFQVPLLDVDLDGLGGRFRNYDAYCHTLLRLPQLRRKHILPGHRDYVDGLDETVLFYLRKLLERARRIRTLGDAEGFALLPLLKRLFGDSFEDVFVVYLKVSEILFLRDFLDDPGLLRGALEEIGLFEPLRAPFAEAIGA